VKRPKRTITNDRNLPTVARRAVSARDLRLPLTLPNGRQVAMSSPVTKCYGAAGLDFHWIPFISQLKSVFPP
jgi:hypothetical protein